MARIPRRSTGQEALALGKEEAWRHGIARLGVRLLPLGFGGVRQLGDLASPRGLGAWVGAWAYGGHGLGRRPGGSAEPRLCVAGPSARRQKRLLGLGPS
jgi:hypothetical protein